MKNEYDYICDAKDLLLMKISLEQIENKESYINKEINKHNTSKKHSGYFRNHRLFI